MAKFESDTGEIVRVTGAITNDNRKNNAYAEVQFFGESIMLTANDLYDTTRPTNLVLDVPEALQLAGALINIADKAKAAKVNPKSTKENVAEIFGRTFDEFDTLEDEWKAWLRS